jgi:hypothetical protein
MTDIKVDVVSEIREPSVRLPKKRSRASHNSIQESENHSRRLSEDLDDI